MNLNKIVEALLFASREPVDSKKIAKIIRKVSKREEADQELCSVKYTEIDEVIEKRLLKKNDNAQKKLETAYKKESAHLESLLSFSEAGVQFKQFDGDIDFGNKFPFVPYQFDLFQRRSNSLQVALCFYCLK